jgi:chitin synthase
VTLLNCSGAIGSGKTEMRRLAIKAICEVSVASPGKKGAKLGGQVANAEVGPDVDLADPSLSSSPLVMLTPSPTIMPRASATTPSSSSTSAAGSKVSRR